MSAPHPSFEGSFLGDAARIADTTRLECKICWYVYDPGKGCEAWQIPPGTPFSQLPSHWRCPNCDAEKTGFMALAEPSAQVVPDCTERAGASTIAPEPADQALRNRARTLTRAFEAAFKELHAGKMREVPLLNKALYVQAIGFQPYESKILGVLLTPWFMNLVIIPDASFDAAKPGTKELINFPSGNYEFIWAARPETGPYMACSLFSPVHELTNQLMAVEVAQAVLIAIFDPENRVEGAKTAEIRAARDQEIAASNAAEAPGDGHSALDAIPSRRAILTGRLEPAELKP